MREIIPTRESCKDKVLEHNFPCFLPLANGLEFKFFEYWKQNKSPELMIFANWNFWKKEDNMEKWGTLQKEIHLGCFKIANESHKIRCLIFRGWWFSSVMYIFEYINLDKTKGIRKTLLVTWIWNTAVWLCSILALLLLKKSWNPNPTYTNCLNLYLN